MTLTSRLIMASGSVAGGSQAYNNPGTYYWTAPAGVTKVDVTGQGGSRSGPSSRWVGVLSPTASIGSSCGHSSSLGSSLSYSSLYSAHVATVNAANSITTNSSGSSYSNILYTTFRLWCSNTSLWGVGSTFAYNGIYRRIGTLSPSSTLANLSGTIPTSPSPSTQNYSATGAQIQRLSTSYTYGTDTTSFGKTFSDNSGQGTYTEVPVVADTQYTIVVGADQGADTAFLTFNYY
jgi:hypothetical protein